MKKKIADINDLHARIKELESLQKRQLEDIKLSFRAMADTLSPSNLMKGVLKTVVGDPGLRSTVIDSAISSGAGLLGKKMVVGGSDNILRKITGTAVQFILANFVRNKMPEIKDNMAASKENSAATNGVEH